MSEIWQIIQSSYQGYANYLWKEITFSNEGGFWHNYFWMLVLVSAFFLILEWIKPWRKKQKKFRKDFWLDFFYMFFNFFLFSLIIFHASSSVVVDLFNDGILKITGINLASLNPMTSWPMWAILLVGFVVRDFVQWWTHRLLHFSPRLWEFHKVHHSVKEMGFAAHLRYHWMETVVYRSIEYVPLALLGVGLHDFFLIHIFTLAWGHYNHANFSIDKRWTGAGVAVLLSLLILTTDPGIDLSGSSIALIAVGLGIVGYFVLGPLMKYIFNSPEMHIWHHVHELPEGYNRGINFGITLAIWDYLFGTAVIPRDGKNIELGFPDDEHFPQTFWSQITHGFRSKMTKS